MKANIRDNVLKYVKIILGAALYAAGYKFFIYPNSLVTGGVAGISTILNYLFRLPVGVMMIVINIPVFLIGAKKLGWRFLIDSAVGTVSLSVLIDVLGMLNISFTRQPLLAALYGGVLMGAGLGTVIATGATTGGTDIVAKLLRMRYQYINMGQFILIMNAAIVIGYAIMTRQADAALYSVVCIFVSSRVMDEVLYGLNYGKLAFIISDEYEEISHEINRIMGRGVTELSGMGAYTGKDKKVIMCAIKKRQIVEIKRIVREADPKAFMIISDTKEILGKGFDKNSAEG